MCMFVCVHTYIYIYIHTYIYTFVAPPKNKIKSKLTKKTYIHMWPLPCSVFAPTVSIAILPRY